jgi:hypothetical protein
MRHEGFLTLDRFLEVLISSTHTPGQVRLDLVDAAATVDGLHTLSTSGMTIASAVYGLKTLMNEQFSCAHTGHLEMWVEHLRLRSGLRVIQRVGERGLICRLSNPSSMTGYGPVQRNATTYQQIWCPHGVHTQSILASKQIIHSSVRSSPPVPECAC